MPAGITFRPWNAGAAPLRPREHVVPGDRETPINGDFYANLKAQAWWQMRLRFERTDKAVTADVEAQYRSWRRSGPPLNIAAVAIARALGVDLIARDDRQAIETRELSPTRPTLALLSADVAMPIAGGETAAASRAILQRLKDMS